MTCDWPLVPIREVADVYDGPHATPKKTSHGPLFLGISCLQRGRLDLSNVEHLSEEDYARWTKRIAPRRDDVVFSYETRLGEAALIPANLRCCLGRRLALVRTRPSCLRPRFFLYYFLGPEFQASLRAKTVHGSTVDRILLTEFADFEVRIPLIDEQDRIVAVLGAIDDRIDSLAETNTTLESVAQAIFKSWFIDFDPVHAKTEGREPEGMDAEMVALFPSEFVESELGPIPKGWRVDEIGKTVSCVGGATPSTKEPAFWEPGEYHWATPKDLSALSSAVLLTTERKISSAGLHKITSGLLPAGTLLLSSRAPIGYRAVTKIPTAINQGFIAMPPGGELPPLYLLFWAGHNLNEIKQRANGSTFMEISKAAFRPIKLVIPPTSILSRFLETVGTLFDRIALNEQTRLTLTQLRDELLPRLISGKLRVPEAHEAVEEALR